MELFQAGFVPNAIYNPELLGYLSGITSNQEAPA
jgi:hypothetical protein